MEKFGLELESSKSRLIEFGRFAEQNRRARGEHKPETFDFLGFTFYCSKNRKGGFASKVQTSRKKFEQKVRAYKNWIYDNRNRPMREIIKELNVKLIGHYRYYGVTWNFRKITTFLHRVQQFLFKAMNRTGIHSGKSDIQKHSNNSRQRRHLNGSCLFLGKNRTGRRGIQSLCERQCGYAGQV